MIFIYVVFVSSFVFLRAYLHRLRSRSTISFAMLHRVAATVAAVRPMANNNEIVRIEQDWRGRFLVDFCETQLETERDPL